MHSWQLPTVLEVCEHPVHMQHIDAKFRVLTVMQMKVGQVYSQGIKPANNRQARHRRQNVQRYKRKLNALVTKTVDRLDCPEAELYQEFVQRALDVHHEDCQLVMPRCR